MKITRVVKKDENNVVVYLENDEKLFLTYEVFLKNGLRKDTEIPADHFQFLIRENQKYHSRIEHFHTLAEDIIPFSNSVQNFARKNMIKT